MKLIQVTSKGCDNKMIVSSTELQNNFGKYLLLANQEDIIVTRNGNAIAKLTTIKDDNPTLEHRSSAEIINERVEKYGDSLKKATYEEFIELTNSTGERYEYIDGEIYLLASPKTVHQVVLMELFVLFYQWFEGKPCRPFIAPYDIELRRSPDNINIVQPDLMVICDLDQHLNEHDYYKGVPALVVEIVSESTRRKDMITKLDLYLCCGVTEYWIVNPLNKEVTVYLFENANIHNSVTYKNNDSIHSFIFSGLQVGLDRIFKS